MFIYHVCTKFRKKISFAKFCNFSRILSKLTRQKPIIVIIWRLKTAQCLKDNQEATQH